jgi:DNA-binding transcriptional LysR family regulator
LAALDGSDLVLYAEGSRTRTRVMHRLAARDVTLTIEVDGKVAAIEYVRRGFGVSFISAVPWYAPREKGVVAHDVTRLFPRASFHLLLTPARAAAAEIRRFADLVRGEVARRSS